MITGRDPCGGGFPGWHLDGNCCSDLTVVVAANHGHRWWRLIAIGFAVVVVN